MMFDLPNTLRKKHLAALVLLVSFERKSRFAQSNRQHYQALAAVTRQFWTVDLTYYETTLFLAYLALGLRDYGQAAHK